MVFLSTIWTWIVSKVFPAFQILLNLSWSIISNYKLETASAIANFGLLVYFDLMVQSKVGFWYTIVTELITAAVAFKWGQGNKTL